LQRVCGLFDAQAREKAELDEPRQLCIDLLEPLDRLVERGKHRVLVRGEGKRIGQRDAIERRPSFLRASRPGAFDENLAHRSRRDADEVTPVVPWRARVGETQIRLVDERRRLQCLSRSLAPYVGASEAAELLIDEWCKLVDVEPGIGGHVGLTLPITARGARA